MEGLERRSKSSGSMKLGITVLVILSGIALAALVILVVSEIERVRSEDVANSTEIPPEVTIEPPLTSTDISGGDHSEAGANITHCKNVYQKICESQLEQEATPSEKTLTHEVENNLKNMVNDFKLEKLEEIHVHARLLHTLYLLCDRQDRIDLKSISEAKKLLEGWPLLEGNKTKNILNIESLWEIESNFKHKSLEGNGLIKMTLEFFGQTFLIKIGRPDFKNTTYIADSINHWMIRRDLALLFGIDKTSIKNNIERALDFEKTLEQLIDSRKNETSQKVVSYDELKKDDKLFKSIPWDTVKAGLAGKVDIKEIKYQIEDQPYLVGLNGILKNKSFSFTNASSYLYWRAVDEMAPYLGKDYRTTDIPHDFCLETITRDMGPTATIKYMKEFSRNKESKQEVEEIVKNIRQELINHVKRASQNEEKKNSTIEKIKNVTVHLGYPENLMKLTSLTEYYNNVMDINISTSFLQAHLKLTELNRNKFLEKDQLSKWVKFGDVMAPCTGYSTKGIVINFRQLEPPYFIPSMTSSEKYGSLGFTIADLYTKVLEDLICKNKPCNEAVSVAWKAQTQSMLQAVPSVRPMFAKLQQYNAKQLFIVTVVNSTCKKYEEFKVNRMMKNSREFNDAFNCIINSNKIITI